MRAEHYRVRGLVLRAAIIGSLMAISASAAWAQTGKAPVESEYKSLFGRYNVSDGFSNRTFTSSWGNYYRADGWGAHVETHSVWREENAAMLAGGLSYNTAAYSIKGVVGTSTNNQLVMPEFYGRLEGASYSAPDVGIVFRPAVTFRSYRAGIEETTIEAAVQKYVPHGKDTTWVFQAFARTAFISLGNHNAPAGGGDITFAAYKKWSAGFAVEGGIASYSDAFITNASLSEHFVAARPHASLYLTDKVELFAQGEFVDRTSYRIYGAHVGFKIALD